MSDEEEDSTQAKTKVEKKTSTKKNKYVKKQPHAPPKAKTAKPKGVKEIEYDRADLTKPLPLEFKLFCYIKYNNVPQLKEVNILERKAIGPENKTDLVDFNDYYTRPPEEHLPDKGVNLPQFDDHFFMYYVHYKIFDRRMDEWVPRKRLRLPEEVKDIKITDEGDHHEKARPKVPIKKEKVEGVDANSYNPNISAPETHVVYAGKGKGKGKEGAPKISSGEEKSAEDEHKEVHAGGQHHGFTEEEVKAHEKATKVKYIVMIALGKYEISTWYYSPFPQEFNRFPRLYFCEFHLCYFGRREELQRHQQTCTLRHPPGNEIYRSKETKCQISVWEIDGARERTYCENLCYIAKLFLDHKTLQYDCTPFLLYVLCEVYEWGHIMVGYFSKEKESASNYNLACIMTLPCYQGQGYGKFLISLSYELSKIEEKSGSPEKPISDLGQPAFDSYWTEVLLDVFETKTESDSISVEDLSKITRLIVEDIHHTLLKMQVLVYHNNRWVLNLGQIKRKLQERAVSRVKNAEKYRQRVGYCDPLKLHWVPYDSSFTKPNGFKKPRLC